MELKNKLFPYESNQLADHEIGVFWNFLDDISSKFGNTRQPVQGPHHSLSVL